VVRRCRRHRASRPDGLDDLDLLLQPIGARPVRLVHYEQVGHFHESGLHGLDPVPGLGHEDHYGRVGVRRHLELRLTDTHRLEENVVESERVHQVRGLAGRGGQPAMRAPAGHGSNEDPRLRREVVHAHTVAQKGAAGERAARIYGHDAHRLTAVTKKARYRRREGGLPGPRRAGDARPPRPPYPFMKLVQ
jgi:hypothetical protein